MAYGLPLLLFTGQIRSAFVILTSFVSLGRRRSQTVGHPFISRRKPQQRFGNILVAHQRRHALVVRCLPAQFLFIHSRENDSNGDWWR